MPFAESPRRLTVDSQRLESAVVMSNVVFWEQFWELAGTRQ